MLEGVEITINWAIAIVAFTVGLLVGTWGRRR